MPRTKGQFESIAIVSAIRQVNCKSDTARSIPKAKQQGHRESYTSMSITKARQQGQLQEQYVNVYCKSNLTRSIARAIHLGAQPKLEGNSRHKEKGSKHAADHLRQGRTQQRDQLIDSSDGAPLKTNVKGKSEC